MRKIREKVQTKLNSMASILLDDIIVVGEKRQEGSESIIASFYDHEGNKFTFNLSLTITPEEIEQFDPAPTLSEQMTMILTELDTIRAKMNVLEGYHNTDEPVPDVVQEPETSETDPTTDTTNNGETSG